MDEDQQLMQQFSAKDFGEWMLACEHSAAYRKFCQKVYGGNLCQFNMLTQTQLIKLFEVLQISKDENVLDVGCGTGSITEYVANYTGAVVMGIDFSDDAIKFAQNKTRGKQDQLSFQTMNMNGLNLSSQSFDVILSIDTLYFASDLRKTVETIKTSMKPHGRMGIYYSVAIGAEQPTDLFTPAETLLGKTLTECGLSFDTWDFTADDKEMWEKQIQTANELKPNFEMEGNQFIYDGRIGEASEALRLINTGRTRRYLFHARL